MTDKSSEGTKLAVQAQKKPEAFEALMVHYQQQLFLYVLQYIYDEDIAKDIVQEAFTKMYINLRSFDPSRQFSAWAYRIAHNEMVNYLRKNKRTIRLNEEFQYSDMFDDHPDLAEEIDKDIEAQQLHSLLQKIPMKYREVLVLHYFQNYDYESIATIINKPTSTVGTRLRRAKAQLKQLHVRKYGNAT